MLTCQEAGHDIVEARAAPEREKVRRMVEEYQLRWGNGGQEASVSVTASVQEKFANYRPGSDARARHD